MKYIEKTLLIRDYQINDADALARLMHASVHEVASKDYSQQQVNAWSPTPASATQFAKRVSDGRSVYVAEMRGSEIAGFIELETNGHIDCFYCAPSFAGQGVGCALYRHLEGKAFLNGCEELTVEASTSARKFFLKHRFEEIQRNDFVTNGVQVHNFLMRKRLFGRHRCSHMQHDAS